MDPGCHHPEPGSGQPRNTSGRAQDRSGLGRWLTTDSRTAATVSGRPVARSARTMSMQIPLCTCRLRGPARLSARWCRARSPGGQSVGQLGEHSMRVIRGSVVHDDHLDAARDHAAVEHRLQRSHRGLETVSDAQTTESFGRGRSGRGKPGTGWDLFSLRNRACVRPASDSATRISACRSTLAHGEAARGGLAPWTGTAGSMCPVAKFTPVRTVAGPPAAHMSLSVTLQVPSTRANELNETSDRAKQHGGHGLPERSPSFDNSMINSEGQGSWSVRSR